MDLKQLEQGDEELGEVLVKEFPGKQLKWLVSVQGFDITAAAVLNAALRTATIDALHGVAIGRALAICAAFTGETVCHG